MTRPIRISITTGDVDGIGSEIAARALAKLKPQKNVHFFLWRSPLCPKSHLKVMDRSFKRISVASWSEALAVRSSSERELIDINSSLQPPHWVEISAKAAMFGHLDAIVTAPLSKTSIHDAGFKDVGHTDMLRRISKQELFMAFIGKEFPVLLVTDHIGLSKVPKVLNEKLLTQALNCSIELQKMLPGKGKRLPIALLGLNPHCGEEGIIADEERSYFHKVISNFNESRTVVKGPLAPDTAFCKENWKRYSIFVAPYHDVGLAPFKLVHGQNEGVHVTMGLPFVRTSVTHGTAKDLFKKNKAKYGSMYDALKWAILLCK